MSSQCSHTAGPARMTYVLGAAELALNLLFLIKNRGTCLLYGSHFMGFTLARGGPTRTAQHVENTKRLILFLVSERTSAMFLVLFNSVFQCPSGVTVTPFIKSC